MPTNLHSPLKDEISPISTDDEFSRTGKKSSLDNSTSMKTSVNLTVFEGFFFSNTLRTARQLPKPTEVLAMQESPRLYSSLLPFAAFTSRLTTVSGKS